MNRFSVSIFKRVELTQTYNEFHGRRNATSDLNNNLPENRSGPLFEHFFLHAADSISCRFYFYFCMEKHKHKMRFHTARVLTSCVPAVTTFRSGVSITSVI